MRMIYHPLGKTGVQVSLTGMSGAHLSRKPLDMGPAAASR